jgi:hypothetical protein
VYSLGTWFVSGIYVCINTLQKGDKDNDNDNNDDNNTNNNNLIFFLRTLETTHRIKPVFHGGNQSSLVLLRRLIRQSPVNIIS